MRRICDICGGQGCTLDKHPDYRMYTVELPDYYPGEVWCEVISRRPDLAAQVAVERWEGENAEYPSLRGGVEVIVRDTTHTDGEAKRWRVIGEEIIQYHTRHISHPE